jgi:hypothetical protein
MGKRHGDKKFISDNFQEKYRPGTDFDFFPPPGSSDAMLSRTAMDGGRRFFRGQDQTTI